MSALYEVEVSNPQKSSESVFGYVVYTVNSRNSIDNVEQSVYRRYSDFLWLQDRLREEYKSVVVPPMPEKAMNKYTNAQYDADFLLYRTRELTRFLKRCAAHERLSKDPNFEFFLNASSDQFRARTEGRDESPESKQILTAEGKALVGGVKSLFRSIKIKTSEIAGAPKATRTETDDYFDRLEQSVNRTMTAIDRQYDAASVIAEAMSSLASAMEENTSALRQTKDIIPVSDTLVHRMDHTIQGCSQAAQCLGDLQSSFDLEYGDNIRDFYRELQCVRRVLDNRRRLINEYILAEREAQKKNSKHAAANEQKFLELKDKLDFFNAEAAEEIEAVLARHKEEYERVMTNYMAVHLACFENLASIWEASFDGTNTVKYTSKKPEFTAGELPAAAEPETKNPFGMDEPVQEEEDPFA